MSDSISSDLNITTNHTSANGYVYPFLLDKGTARGKIVRLGSEFLQMVQVYAHVPFIQEIMAELALFGATLIPDFKSKGTVTLQITGAEHISLIVVELSQSGSMRGCAKFNEEELIKILLDTPKDELFKALLQKGQFVLTTQFEHMHEIQQAIIGLEGNTVSECLVHYFDQSVQIPTSFKTAVLTNEPIAPCAETSSTHIIDLKSNTPLHNRAYFQAAGILVQKLPAFQNDENNFISTQEREDHWNTFNVFLETIKADELLSPLLSCDQLLHRLFHEYEIHIYAPQHLKYECTCSRPQLVHILGQFNPTDIADMSIDSKIEIDCDYCRQHYEIDMHEIVNVED